MTWYAVRSKPNAEAAARDRLERQDYDTFLPLSLQPRLDQRGHLAFVERPHFVGYLFCAVMDDQPIAPIRSTTGVASIVSNAAGPLPVPWPVITELKALVDEHDIMPTDWSAPARAAPIRFLSGDLIDIREGPFAGLRGVVATVDLPVLRAWVAFLGAPRLVTLRETWVEPGSPE